MLNFRHLNQTLKNKKRAFNWNRKGLRLKGRTSLSRTPPSCTLGAVKFDNTGNTSK